MNLIRPTLESLNEKAPLTWAPRNDIATESIAIEGWFSSEPEHTDHKVGDSGYVAVMDGGDYRGRAHGKVIAVGSKKSGAHYYLLKLNSGHLMVASSIDNKSKARAQLGDSNFKGADFIGHEHTAYMSKHEDDEKKSIETFLKAMGQ